MRYLQNSLLKFPLRKIHTKRKFLVLYIVFFLAIFLSSCNSQKESSIDKKKEICRNQAFIALSARNRLDFTGTVSFKYSCSANAGYSPSCFEYFASFEKDDPCPIGYTKSKLKCSTQNLIGICRYVPTGSSGQTVTVVFAKPGDSDEQARTYCGSADINGIFSTTYLEPSAQSTTSDQALLNFVICDSKAEKN